MHKTIFLNKNIEVLVVSYGGVGTTFITEEIAKYRKTNSAENADGYKHLIVPPFGNKNVKVIYLFGDPITSVVSLFRRGFHVSHAHMIQKYLPGKVTLNHTTTIESYAENQVDAFRFKLHFRNWHQQYRWFDTLFLKYDHVYEHLDQIAKFLNLPEEFILEFPEKKSRSSSIKNLNHQTLINLQKMYGDFADSLAQLPDWQHKKRERDSFWRVLISPTYRNAFWYAFLQKYAWLRKIRNRIIR